MIKTEVSENPNGTRKIELSENGRHIEVTVNDQFEVIYFQADQGWGIPPERCKPRD